jgi:hypothetical protein
MEKRIFKPKKSTLIFTLLLGIALCGLFIYVCIYITYYNPNIFKGFSKIILLILNSFIILFFIFMLFITIQQTLNGKSALIISPEGIYNGTELICKTFVPWRDVEKICVNTYIIVIHLKDTEKYIQMQKGRLKRSILKNRVPKFGSPIFIDYFNLDANISELQSLLYEGYNNYSN